MQDNCKPTRLLMKFSRVIHKTTRACSNKSTRRGIYINQEKILKELNKHPSQTNTCLNETVLIIRKGERNRVIEVGSTNMREQNEEETNLNEKREISSDKDIMT